ncbi:uncharacterized protein K489DRAFT_68067 [Dissoconium aciculare CBS 342.82]|uniref:Uncharacterized protein n=1 Tax=Dissoconium aciculare CBS 342.82 TaxID=1314786 RepID=A0A6J3LUR0_9PEZI|nr:uncharacterized protein K489DRAFT_68067 [Dissoconium aciculare CBS 342.82]KAF1819510.1 hypothetical protein K489DRAFT_68067 [Dissoconium aciculare CBS 342.82]
MKAARLLSPPSIIPQIDHQSRRFSSYRQSHAIHSCSHLFNLTTLTTQTSSNHRLVSKQNTTSCAAHRPLRNPQKPPKNQKDLTRTRFERITFRSGVERATVAPAGRSRDPNAAKQFGASFGMVSRAGSED